MENDDEHVFWQNFAIKCKKIKQKFAKKVEWQHYFEDKAIENRDKILDSYALFVVGSKTHHQTSVSLNPEKKLIFKRS